MKHFTFLTNWSSRKSVQVMTRTKPGNDHDLSKTCVRLDSLSILSRQSVLRTYVGRIAAILVLVLTVGSGNVWGAADYTYTLAEGDFGTSDHTQTSGTITWTASNFSGTESYGWDGTYGFKFGSSNSSYPTAFKLTSSSFSNKIKKVVVTANVNSKKSCKLDVKVGSTTYGSQETINTKNDDTWEFSKADASTVNGAVELSFSSNTGPLYLKKIEVYYYSGASKTLSSIAITTAPTKTAYLVGQTFSSTGAVVTATYSDATTANVSASATWTPTTGLVSGSNTITASYTEGGVTRTATTTVTGYTVTVQVKDVDGNTLSGVGAPTASATGASITASASGNNYVFKRWVAVTAAGTSFADASNRSTTLSGTPTGAVTIKAEYYKPITITYKANGSTFTTQTYARGGTLAFPVSNHDGATYSCTGKTFVGWVAEANKDYSHASTPPTYATAGGSVTTDATYYAVFATASGGGGYEQVTSLAEIHEGSAYFACYGQYSSIYKWYGVNAINTVTAPVDVTTGVLTPSKTGDGAYTLLEFTLEAVDASAYEYYIKVGNQYVTGSSTNKSDLTLGNDAYLWKFNSINGSNDLEILHDAATDCWIKVGISDGTSGKFRSYTSTGNQVRMFQSSTTYSNYATSCCTALGTINGSVNLTYP